MPVRLPYDRTDEYVKAYSSMFPHLGEFEALISLSPYRFVDKDKMLKDAGIKDISSIGKEVVARRKATEYILKKMKENIYGNVNYFSGEHYDGLLLAGENGMASSFQSILSKNPAGAFAQYSRLLPFRLVNAKFPPKYMERLDRTMADPNRGRWKAIDLPTDFTIPRRGTINELYIHPAYAREKIVDDWIENGRNLSFVDYNTGEVKEGNKISEQMEITISNVAGYVKDGKSYSKVGRWEGITDGLFTDMYGMKEWWIEDQFISNKKVLPSLDAAIAKSLVEREKESVHGSEESNEISRKVGRIFRNRDGYTDAFDLFFEFDDKDVLKATTMQKVNSVFDEMERMKEDYKFSKKDVMLKFSSFIDELTRKLFDEKYVDGRETASETLSCLVGELFKFSLDREIQGKDDKCGYPDFQNK